MDINIIDISLVILAVVTIVLLLREMDQDVVKKIINNFLEPAIKKLNLEKQPNYSFSIPNSLIDNFGIGENDEFNRFKRKNPIVGICINKYNAQCKEINQEIEDYRKKLQELGFVHSVLNLEIGQEMELTSPYDGYSPDEINDFLRENEAYNEIESIGKKVNELSKKANKLHGMLIKKKQNWIKKYRIP